MFKTKIIENIYKYLFIVFVVILVVFMFLNKNVIDFIYLNIIIFVVIKFLVVKFLK